MFLQDNKKGDVVNENLFDYIYRHTFGRPREIVEMGKHLNHIDISSRGNVDKVKNEIHKISNRLFNQLKNEIFPFFDDLEYEEFCELANTNIIERKKLNYKHKNYLNIMNSFYKKGLVGYVSKKTDGSHTQIFLPVAETNFLEGEPLPNSDYYLIHPALEENLKTRNFNFSHNRLNVVGNGYPFYYTRSKKFNDIHVHFGAGKLGIGLVLPQISKSHKVVIIQRPGKEWNKIKNDQVAIVINGKKHSDYKYITDINITNLKKQLPNNNYILLCTDNKELIEYVLSKAKSISTTLGPNLKRIIPHFCNVKYEEEINIYPFENDDKLVAQFDEELVTSNHKIIVIPTIADRICFERKTTRNAIEIMTEPYEGVIFLHEKNDQVYPFFDDTSSDQLAIIKTYDEFKFFQNRKTWLLNGIHMIMALCCYSILSTNKVNRKSWDHYCTNIFKESTKINTTLDVFITVQVLRLLLNTDEKVISKIYNNKDYEQIFHELNGYGQEVKKRLFMLPDKIARILELSSLNTFGVKYERRIGELIEFIKENGSEIETMISRCKVPITIDKINIETISLLREITEILLNGSIKKK